MKEISIFKRVLLTNLKIVMIPIILIMFLVGYFISDSIKNNAINEAKAGVKSYAESVNSEISKVITMSENTARYPLVYNGLNTEYVSYFSAFTFLEEARIFLDNLTYEQSDETLTICFENNSLFKGKYFIPADDMQGYETVQKKFSTSEMNIIWEENIYKDENGKEYFQFYEDMPLNSGCFIIGKIYLPERPENIQVIMSDKKSEGGSTDVRCEINTHFDAIGAVNYGEVYKSSIQIYLVLILITSLLLLILFYTTQKTTAKVTRDINSFIGQLDVNDIANEQLDLEIKTGEAAELSIIKGTISRLLAQINEITTSKHNTELEKKTLEFELLQSQIDPHTLYNSLSAIRLGAFKRQDTEMIDFVDTMVSYYRKVLNKGKTLSVLSDEIDLITKYVKINELSHYKKYNLSVYANDCLMHTEILHLLLQPFVENAIIHGLGGSKQNCEINIKCFDKDGFLNITVEDNGRGMDEEKLKKLNNLEEHEIGYGVKNAYMRLKLYYGNDASVRFESTPKCGTKVTICYPI